MSEADWEQLVLDELADLEWQPKHGKELAPGSKERESWADIVLHGTLSQKLRDLNPGVPEEYLQQAKAEVLAPQSQDALAENKRLHDILIRGYAGITYVDDEGRDACQESSNVVRRQPVTGKQLVHVNPPEFVSPTP